MSENSVKEVSTQSGGFKQIEFVADIILEFSGSPGFNNLGKAKCSMELFIHNLKDNEIPKDGSAGIEWILEYLDEDGNPDGDDDVVEIGLTFENKKLIEYDGVFSLPKQAIQLIRKAGITVPRDF